ncbi:hypothetical protein MUK42_19322 [Musa troglodytarum]|uniref:Uncharacterized protein n=1 Tax=Musa troglodytarum TaxID=320322 RepID=A0A9E7G3C4_9LILI|nr:hypothetical protein MUK42_19322 [Musa troglodytarum]
MTREDIPNEGCFAGEPKSDSSLGNMFSLIHCLRKLVSGKIHRTKRSNPEEPRNRSLKRPRGPSFQEWRKPPLHRYRQALWCRHHSRLHHIKGSSDHSCKPADKAPTVTVSQDLPSWGMNSINSVKETVESVDFKRSTFDNGMFNNPLAIFCGELLAVSSLSPPVA